MALEQGHFIRLFEKLHQQQQEQILMLYVIILVIYKNTMFINVCMCALCVCVRADKSSVTAVMYANIVRTSSHNEELYINIRQDN